MARSAKVQAEHWRSYAVIDTVEAPWPSPNGAEYEFFRDLANKQEQHCNLRRMRQLSEGRKLRLAGVAMALSPWSGDDVAALIRAHAFVTFKINDRLLFQAPLAMMQNGEVCKVMVKEPILITSNDDLSGQLVFRVSSAFSTPELREAKAQVADGWLTRPIQGSCLARIELHGELSEPLGL
jgi:hypothetical protein